jgi:hypothetical protein
MTVLIILDDDEIVDKINDSYLTFYNEVLLFCCTTKKQNKWLKIKDVPITMYNNFLNSQTKKMVEISSCNTEKTKLTIYNKCKTRVPYTIVASYFHLESFMDQKVCLKLDFFY